MAIALKASSSAMCSAKDCGTTLISLVQAVSGTTTTFYNHNWIKVGDDRFIATVVYA